MLKIRLGGESIPTSSAVARVVCLCAELGVALKATAGLHHAVRSESRGFSNLVLAHTTTVVFNDPPLHTRSFVNDGDEMLRGCCEREGYRRIGFGECRARVLPARSLS